MPRMQMTLKLLRMGLENGEKTLSLMQNNEPEYIIYIGHKPACTLYLTTLDNPCSVPWRIFSTVGDIMIHVGVS